MDMNIHVGALFGLLAYIFVPSVVLFLDTILFISFAILHYIRPKVYQEYLLNKLFWY